jgi:membrane-associated PAP2 superfamily phosphatase
MLFQLANRKQLTPRTQSVIFQLNKRFLELKLFKTEKLLVCSISVIFSCILEQDKVVSRSSNAASETRNYFYALIGLMTSLIALLIRLQKFLSFPSHKKS